MSKNKSGHQLIWSDNVLVYIGNIEDQKSIIINPNRERELLTATMGTIVDMGSDAFKTCENKPKIGDVVCFPMYSHRSIKLAEDDTDYYFVQKDTSIDTIKID